MFDSDRDASCGAVSRRAEWCDGFRVWDRQCMRGETDGHLEFVESVAILRSRICQPLASTRQTGVNQIDLQLTQAAGLASYQFLKEAETRLAERDVVGGVADDLAPRKSSR